MEQKNVEYEKMGNAQSCEGINQFPDYANEQKRKWNEDREWFLKLGPASLLYAIIFTLCRYDNQASIMTPIWIGTTCFYVYYVMKKIEITWKKDSILFIIFMMLLGVSSVLTGNGVIQFFNEVGFFLLLIYFLIHNFYDDKKWGLDKVCVEIIQSIIGAIGMIPSPFEEGMAYLRFRDQKKARKNYAVLLGIALALPFVILIGVCLGTADAVFAHLFMGIVNVSGMDNLSEAVVLVPFMLAFGFFSSYCGIRFFANQNRQREPKQLKKFNATIAIAFSSMFTLMYVIFSVIQIVYLFLGYGELPEGMTYATYARTGFFQLLFVTILNVFFVLLTKKFFEERKLLTISLLTICVCTLIMAASSAYRMFLYISCYHLTFIRVAVLVTLATIGALMIGIIVYLCNQRFPLFRYSLFVVCFIYIGFSFSHVDYWIASYNVEHMTEENKKDILSYMDFLSTDAAPVIQSYVVNNGLEEQAQKEVLMRFGVENPTETYEDALSWYGNYISSNYSDVMETSLRKWNVSSYLASKQLYLPEK